MKKRYIFRLVLPLAVLAVLALGFLFHRLYLIMDGAVYYRGTRQLQLSELTQAHWEKLPQLTQLELLDVQAQPLTPEDHSRLQQLVPDCRILWQLAFQDTVLPLDTTTLTLTSLSEADVAALDALTQLETVDATACRDYEALLALQARRPQCRVLYRVSVDGKEYDQDAAAIAGQDIAQLEQALACLPHVEKVDAAGCTAYAQLTKLRQAYPQCRFTYTIGINGLQIPYNVRDLVLSADAVGVLSGKLSYFPNLRTITFTEPVTDIAALSVICTVRPEITIRGNFRLGGQEFSPDAEDIDLSGIALNNLTAAEQVVRCFCAPKRIQMHNCGVPDEDMDTLRQRYPDTEFVWTVKIGKISLRTDVTYFMPYQYYYEVTDEDCRNLKYCRDIICMDLGHMPISEVPALAYLTKMQYLILASTEVSDISFCANMPDLKYLELFITKVTDYSPLLHCPKLEDLNLCYNDFSDVSDLCKLTQLKNLWVRGYGPQPFVRLLAEALPEETVIRSGNGSSTGGGWRELQNYYDMRDILGMPYFTD